MAKEENLQLLKSSVASWNRRQESLWGVGPGAWIGDFDGADLSGLHLAGANFHRCRFRCANFSHTNLDGADLSPAYLTGADLYATSLVGANLEYAILAEALRISVIDLKIINVAIVKPRIHAAEFDVLDTALKFSVQRIENDLTAQSQNRFMIITDWGRVGKMRKTTRRVQKINFIPSKFGPTPRRQEIQKLIEDPLPKDSSESYFIQLADLTACVVSLYAVARHGIGGFPRRWPASIKAETVIEWMKMLMPVLNTKAAGDDEYGVKFHPSH